MSLREPSSIAITVVTASPTPSAHTLVSLMHGESHIDAMTGPALPTTSAEAVMAVTVAPLATVALSVSAIDPSAISVMPVIPVEPVIPVIPVMEAVLAPSHIRAHANAAVRVKPATTARRTLGATPEATEIDTERDGTRTARAESVLLGLPVNQVILPTTVAWRERWRQV